LSAARLLLARGLFDQAGELAVVVFEETEDAEGLGCVRLPQPQYYIERSYLSIMRVLDGFVECAGGQVMLLPRDGDSAVKRGRRGDPDVLVRFGEGGRLHAGVVEVNVGPTCQRVGGEVKVIVGQGCQGCDPCMRRSAATRSPNTRRESHVSCARPFQPQPHGIALIHTASLPS
jgi:hypothetical protein